MFFSLLGITLSTVLGSFVTFSDIDGYINGSSVSEGMLSPVTDTFLNYVEVGNVTAEIENQKLKVSQPSGVSQSAWVRDDSTVGYVSSFSRSAEVTLVNSDESWVNVSMIPGCVSIQYDSLGVTEFNNLYILDCLIRNKTQTAGQFLIRRHDAGGTVQSLNTSTGTWGSSVYTEFDISHTLRVSYEFDHTLLSNQLFMTVYDVTASNLLVDVQMDLEDVANTGGTNTVRMVAGDLFSAYIGEGDFCLDNLRSQSGPEPVTIGGGGHVQELVVDSSGTMWLGTGVSGLFKSEDGGDSWENCQGLPGWWIQGIAVCDDYPGTVYSATENGLYLSEDDGQTWRDAGLQGKVCSAVAFTKTSSGDRVVMASVGDVLFDDKDGDGKIYRSVNGGAFSEQSLTNMMTLVTESNKSYYRPVYSIVMHPDAQTVYVSTGDGVFATLNGGMTWTDITRNLPHRRCREMTHKPGAYTDLLVALADDGVTGGGVYRKKWGETVWTDYSGNLPANDTYYSVVAGLSASYDQTMMVIRQSGEGGVFKTTDGGQTWSETFINNLSERGWITWPKIWFYGLVKDASGNVYVGGQGVLYKTTDNGSIWNQVYTEKQASLASSGWIKDAENNGYLLVADSWRQTGMVNSYPRMVAIDGSNLYYAVVDRGVFFSNDNGESFRNVAFRLHDITTGDLFGVYINPFMPSTLYALPAVGYSSEAGVGAIMKSTNRAASWTLVAGTADNVGDLAGDQEVRDLAFYTGGGANEFEMYAAVVSNGVYTSADGGDSWHAAGLTDKLLLAIGVNPGTPDMILVGASSGEGVWKGLRSGGAWTFTQVLSNKSVWDLAIKNSNTCFAAAWPWWSHAGGLFRTVDWGENWVDVTPPRRNVYRRGI